MSLLKLKTGFSYIEEETTNDRLYRQYLRRIDVQVVLDHYGARNQDQQGDEIVHSCLLQTIDPHHSNGDENPSALANVEEKLYLCRTYSKWRGGDIIQFIMQMEGKERFADVVPLIAAMLDDDNSTELEKKQQFKDELLEAIHGKPAKAVEPVPKLSDRMLKGWANLHPYVLDRGISLEAARRLQIGYDPVAIRITIPHWLPGGQLVGWQKRALTDPRWLTSVPEKDGSIPKYKNNKGFPKLSTVYNLNRVRDRGIQDVIVVESPMSVAMAETLMTSDQDRLAGVLAVFGASMPDEQIRLLEGFNRVTVYMDDDGAGRGAAKRIAKALYRHTMVDVVQAERGKDLGDYRSRDEVMAVIGRAEPAFLAMARWNKESDSDGQRRKG